MAKGHRHRVKGNLPPPSIPYPVQNRILREQISEVKRVANKMRRMLWVAVHEAGGRVEMDEGDYKMAMQMPDEDCIVSVEHDEPAKKVILIFTDKEGKRLPESEPARIIATDADKPNRK